MIALNHVDAVIFDCDGLLVDSEPCWFRAEESIFADYGRPYTTADQARLLGTEYRRAAAVMAAMLGRPQDADEVAGQLLARTAAQIRAGVEALPGAVAFARACAARVPVCVASNSPRELVDLMLRVVGLAALPVVTAADVAAPKPAPDLYLAACARVGAEPARAVAFEDSPTGARSARAAGLYVVAVPSLPGQQVDADLVRDTLADPALAAWAAGLPRRADSRG